MRAPATSDAPTKASTVMKLPRPVHWASLTNLLSVPALVTISLGFALSTGTARADQRRDFMLDIQPPGTFLVLDYFGTGGQLTLEHRMPIYGVSNDFTASASVIPSYPLGEATVGGDLRVLFVNFGGSVSYRSVWRDLTFDAGENTYCVQCDRAARRKIDPLFGRAPGSDNFLAAEGDVSVLLPFNENLVMQSLAALRYEGRHDRSFDWFYASIYDKGVLGRWETSLFLKDRNWGGIGPYVQLLMLPRAGEHVAQWAAGFNAVTRVGLIGRNDLLFLTFLIRPGDGTYGHHAYYMPVRSLLIYRMILEL
jgi:hypothetical protein